MGMALSCILITKTVPFQLLSKQELGEFELNPGTMFSAVRESLLVGLGWQQLRTADGAQVFFPARNQAALGPWEHFTGGRGRAWKGTSGREACDVVVTTLWCTLNNPCKLWVQFHFYTK